jgi:NADPH-dependent 2,4-dienoyl-CoA reductase/sulfur reductase-like enzyme
MTGRRISSAGITPGPATLTFTYEGETIPARAGESVGAALVAAGQLAMRQTRSGKDRGPFCGMGACHECLIMVGGATRRACLEPVQNGLSVTRHRPRSSMPAHVLSHAANAPLSPDVLVVGAGPAGLAGAAVAARAGLSVLLVDERKMPGGQYFKQPSGQFATDEAKLDVQYRKGRKLIDEARRAGVEIRASTTAAAPFEDGLMLSDQDGLTLVKPRRTLLATGASERAVPFPGWTLPGVMTTGAAQTFLRSDQIVPGQRVLIAGNGPLNLQLAAELLRAGVEVVALIEAAPQPRATDLGKLMSMAAQGLDLVRDGIAYRARVALSRVPVIHGHAVIRAEGEGRVARIVIAPIGVDGTPDRLKERLFEADTLCVGMGFVPSSELARALSCQHTHDQRWRFMKPVRDETGRSSRHDVFVAGDGAGFGGARIAEVSGRIAAAQIVTDLGACLSAEDVSAQAKWQAQRAGHQAFQTALWSLYRAPVLFDQLATPETIICRCEEVALRDIDTALAGGITALGALKRETRLGMGRCQGRTCAPLAQERLAAATGRPLSDSDGFAPRPPLRSVTIGEIARLRVGEEELS